MTRLATKPPFTYVNLGILNRQVSTHSGHSLHAVGNDGSVAKGAIQGLV